MTPVPVPPVVMSMVVSAVRVDAVLHVDVPVVMRVRPEPAELLDRDDGEENGEDRQRDALEAAASGHEGTTERRWPYVPTSRRVT